MLVKWNGLGLLGLMCGEKMVALKPGLNTVPDKDWKMAAEHPGIKSRMDDGKLEVVPCEGEANADDPVSVLCAMKVNEAKKAAKETIDLPLLESWFAAEKRKAVSDAIAEQIEALQAPTSRRSDDKK